MSAKTTASLLMFPLMVTPFPFPADGTNTSSEDPASILAALAPTTETATGSVVLEGGPSEPFVPRPPLEGGLTPASLALIIVGATAPIALLLLVAIIVRCRKMGHHVRLKPRRGRRRDVTYAADAVNSIDAATASAVAVPGSAWKDHNGKSAWNDDEMASFNGGTDGGCKILTELAVREFFDVQPPTTPRPSVAVRSSNQQESRSSTSHFAQGPDKITTAEKRQQDYATESSSSDQLQPEPNHSRTPNGSHRTVVADIQTVRSQLDFHEIPTSNTDDGDLGPSDNDDAIDRCPSSASSIYSSDTSIPSTLLNGFSKMAAIDRSALSKMRRSEACYNIADTLASSATLAALQHPVDDTSSSLYSSKDPITELANRPNGSVEPETMQNAESDHYLIGMNTVHDNSSSGNYVTTATTAPEVADQLPDDVSKTASSPRGGDDIERVLQCFDDIVHEYGTNSDNSSSVGGGGGPPDSVSMTSEVSRSMSLKSAATTSTPTINYHSTRL